MSKAINKTKPSERIFPRNPHYTDNDLDHSLLGPCKSGRSEENVSSICTEDIGDVVKGQINRIANTNYTNEQQRKNAYNAFYKKLLDSKGDCTELRILAKKTDGTNVHLWTKDQYTPEIAKMYNILTSSLAVLCNSSDSCNFEEMKALQLEILRETNKLVIEGLGNIDMELNNTIRMIDSENDDLKAGASLETEEDVPVLQKIAVIFGASSEYINENLINLIKSKTIDAVGIISRMIRNMITIMQRVSRMDVVGSFFGALNCYNRFLISAIGNKLTTIFNSVLLAGITVSLGISAGYAVLVDTLNEQNLLQLAATLYYYRQFFEPTMRTLSAAVDLGDSIKIHLMTKIPNLAKEKIDIAANTIRYYIDKLAKPTEDMTLEHTENVVKDITNITKFIEKAIPMINADNVIIVENDEQILLIAEEDRRLLERYLNENVERAAAAAEEEEGEKEYGGGKKHKKSHKKRHQKTHKKQLKPKAKSHKKKNKPKSKSHKKK